jgi:hypothetical protein
MPFSNKKKILQMFPKEAVRVWADNSLVSRRKLTVSWRKLKALVIGETAFGDCVLYAISSSSPVPKGAILVTEHDGEGIIVLAETLAQWIARLVEFNGAEIAVVPGSASDVKFAGKNSRLYAADHLRLNPNSAWARAFSEPGALSGSAKILYYDKQKQRIRPIEELPWLEHVQLENIKSPDLQPLGKLVKLSRLLLHNCQITDLSPLNSARKLVWLGLYDCATTSLKALEGAPKLEQLRVLRTLVTHLDALESIPTLEHLEITECDYDDAKAIGKLTQLSSLELSGTSISTLAPFVCLEKLEYLQIDQTQITDLDPILELPKLRELTIGKEMVAPKILKALRKQRPELEIEVIS